jgi:hypothetical protein
LLLEGLLPLMSKPVCEYESPNVMRYLRAQGSTVPELDAALVVDVVRVEVVRVVGVDEVVALEVDVLLAFVEVLLVVPPGMHWSIMV